MAAMQQVAEWLEKLGMSEYAQRFIENRIDCPSVGFKPPSSDGDWLEP
jgi:hypothetical protein